MVEGAENFPAMVLGLMLHNEPLLEATLIAPLILKRLEWSLLATVLMAVATFGVELHNNYDFATWISGHNLPILLTQVVTCVILSTVIFLAKIQILKRFLASKSGGSGAT